MAVGAALVGLTAAHAQAPLVSPTFTVEQARRGEAAFQTECASCHGDQLNNGDFAAPLKGPTFKAHWGAGGLDGPFGVMTTRMPPTNPGGMAAEAYVDVLAFILSKNGVAPSDQELPADIAALKKMQAPR